MKTVGSEVCGSSRLMGQFVWEDMLLLSSSKWLVKAEISLLSICSFWRCWKQIKLNKKTQWADWDVIFLQITSEPQSIVLQQQFVWEDYGVKLDFQQLYSGLFSVMLTLSDHYISANSAAADQLCDVAVIWAAAICCRLPDFTPYLPTRPIFLRDSSTSSFFPSVSACCQRTRQ